MNFFVFLFIVFMFAYVIPRMGSRRDEDDGAAQAYSSDISHLRERVATLERVVIDRDNDLRRDIDRLR